MHKLLIVTFLASGLTALIIFGLISYSYTQIDVSFKEVSSVNVKMESLSFASLLKLGLDALSENWLTAALNVITEINLGLILELNNSSPLPVYIPKITYDLYVNQVFVGSGSSLIDTTINPGENKKLEVIQTINQSSFSPAIISIINTDGIMNIKIKGIGYLDFFGFSMPVEFESKKKISIIDEIQSKLNQKPRN